MSAIAELYEQRHKVKLDLVIEDLQHAFYRFGLVKEDKNLMYIYLIQLLIHNEEYATEIIQEYKRLKGSTQ